MITYKEAQQIILSHARSFGSETVALENSFNRVIIDTVRADRDYPPFNRAAMDGYAMRYADIEQGIRQFSIVETVYAGQVATKSIEPGQCYKIMTGAAVPANANIIVRREDTAEQQDHVTINIESTNPFQHIARQGEDVLRDAVLISQPVMATPAVISLLATVGQSTITVARKPKVAVVTTGNEVMPVDSIVNPVQIRNSNAWALQTMLAKQHITPFAVVHVHDDKEQLQTAFSKLLEADIIISCGGVSAGDADYVPGVLQSLGVEQLFHKTSIKPGKPAWCGCTPAGGIWFALPGNPFSCMVTFRLFVLPYLHACYGIAPPLIMQLNLQGKRCKKSSLDEFFPVRVIAGSGNIEQLSINGSGDVQAALFADGLALHPREITCLSNGDVVEFLPF